LAAPAPIHPTDTATCRKMRNWRGLFPIR